MKKILKNATYLWVLTADMLSNFGDVVYYLALMNYVLLVPNSPLDCRGGCNFQCLCRLRWLL
ncbi:hypothetical protein Q7V23_10190 [Streptococcus suis]|nr:hypothetical protein [Streptococcus suis]MDW8590382.1 hypothetical protein [Streptococcus suis]MDW8615979.1 hypothetical protein [Streptococcus suis]